MSDAPAATVYQAMTGAATDITAVGKSLKNEQAGYAARSIDDILDAVHEPLAAAGVVLVPTVLQRLVEERRSNAGKPLYHVALEVQYRFHGPGGDYVDVVAWGEAMDSQDKATNKAMSAALKMALIQTFTIPVAGEDADRHDPDPDPSEPMATPGQVEELHASMVALWEQVGRKAAPAEWRDAGLPTVDFLRQHGATAVQYVDGIKALTAAHTRIEIATATQAPDDPPCCSMDATGAGGHTDGCDQAPFGPEIGPEQ